MSQVLTLWNTTRKLPMGSRIYSVLFAQKAPYFASIRPRFVTIEPNHAELFDPRPAPGAQPHRHRAHLRPSRGNGLKGEHGPGAGRG